MPDKTAAIISTAMRRLALRFFISLNLFFMKSIPSPFDLVGPIGRRSPSSCYVFRMAFFPRQASRPICFRFAFLFWRSRNALRAKPNKFRVLSLRVFYQHRVALRFMLRRSFWFVVSGEPFAPVIYRHNLLAPIAVYFYR